MIPLVTTTETLQIVVSANADVTVSGYQDGTSPPTFKQVTAATTGAARTICSAIATVAVPKNVSHITARTTGGANTVVVQGFDSSGSVTTTQVGAVLAANETLEYTHAAGWRVLDANGAVKYVIAGAVAATTLSVSGDTTLTGDLAVNGGDLTTTATTFNLLAANATTVNAFGAASTALNIGHASAAAAFPGGISIPTGKSVTGTGSATVTGFASVSATALRANTASSTYALEIGSTGADVRARIQGNTAYGLALSNTGAAAVWLGSAGTDTLQVSKGDGTSLGTWGPSGLAATLTTAAQPNITSVGTLTSVTSSGAISGTTGTFSLDLSRTSSNSGGQNVVEAVNTSNTATSTSVVRASVAGSSAGNAALHLIVQSLAEWYTYLHTGDSNAYYIGTGLAGAGTTGLKITTAGAVTIPGTLGVTGKVTATAAGIDVPTSALGTAYSATYTPAITNGTNVAASTAFVTSYARVGNYVQVSGVVNIDPTAASATDWEITLPVASTFANVEELGGAVGASNAGGHIWANPATGKAQFFILPVSTANQTMGFSFGYRVI